MVRIQIVNDVRLFELKIRYVILKSKLIGFSIEAIEFVSIRLYDRGYHEARHRCFRWTNGWPFAFTCNAILVSRVVYLLSSLIGDNALEINRVFASFNLVFSYDVYVLFPVKRTELVA